MPDTGHLLDVPVTDADLAATHAVIPADVSGQDAARAVCDLPLREDIVAVHVATLDRARAEHVNCLLCLGWLGARHTTPPVVVKGSWFPHMPPTLPGETADAFTDRLTGAAAAKYLREHGADVDRLTAGDILTAQVPPEVTKPYDHMRNRQCSIGYHDECTDPAGVACACPCHRAPAKAAAEELLPPNEALDVFDEIAAELHRATVKFPGQHLPLGFGPGVMWLPGRAFRADEVRNVVRATTDRRSEEGTLTWLDVLAEEASEAFAEADPVKARAELVQVAAMCIRAILDIDRPRPVAFSGPSGVHWVQVGTDTDGRPILARDVNDPLTPAAVSTPSPTVAPEAPDA